MYQYDLHDQYIVSNRASQFRDQVHRHLSGEIEEEEFKQLRLRNGLYMQRHAYMLRVAIPYGLLSSSQMHMLANIANQYDRGFGHFTTRQNIQYNWLELEQVPDILDDLARVDMHAIQTSGNVVRNITSDPLAGVCDDEAGDPRPWCELLRQWFSLHPEFNWLPRKFKIAVIASDEDRAAMRWHDIGLRLRHNASGESGFEIFVGGGMGRAPAISKRIAAFLPARYIVSYIEAILRVYNLQGRRDNIHRARIKFLVKQHGIETLRTMVEAEWLQAERETSARFVEREIERIRAFFPETGPAVKPDRRVDAIASATSPQFNDWIKHNTKTHKLDACRIVYISLKAPGIPPGDITGDQMHRLAELADKYSGGLIRASYDQNLLLTDVCQDDLFHLWSRLREMNLATANIGTISDLICCPGLDFCSLANAGSIPVAHQINKEFSDLKELYDTGPLQLKMSGCMNACGHHHAGHIGILGVEKKGVEWYQITLGGSASSNSAIGRRIGAAIPKSEVSVTLRKILDVYRRQRRAKEPFVDVVNRIGIKPFQEKVYGTQSNSDSGQREVVAA